MRFGHALEQALRVEGVGVGAAADVGERELNPSEFDLAVLAAIAYHLPFSRDGLKDIFCREISRDLSGRLADRDLIGTGPENQGGVRVQ